MGQAKRRRQQLGALYGTPAGTPRKPLPSGTVPVSAELLETYLSRDDQVSIVSLLRDGPPSWERRFQPVPEQSNTVAAVLIRCSGDLTTVELLPA